MKLFGRKKKQACVVGLDGVPCTLLRTMMENGVMPRTREIVSRGRAPLDDGHAPRDLVGELVHVHDREEPRRARDLRVHRPQAGDLRPALPLLPRSQTETIWDLVGKRGGRSVVINQPSTYPAREIPGVLISGFVSVDIDKSVQPEKAPRDARPPRLQGRRRHGQVPRQPRAPLLPARRALLDARRAVVDELWSEETWTLMEVVVTGTDRLHHFVLGRVTRTPPTPTTGISSIITRQVDAFIGHVYDKFSKRGLAARISSCLSDHGFCGTRKEFYVNTVLQQNGFLSVRSGVAPVARRDHARIRGRSLSTPRGSTFTAAGVTPRAASTRRTSPRLKKRDRRGVRVRAGRKRREDRPPRVRRRRCLFGSARAQDGPGPAVDPLRRI